MAIKPDVTSVFRSSRVRLSKCQHTGRVAAGAFVAIFRVFTVHLPPPFVRERAVPTKSWF